MGIRVELGLRFAICGAAPMPAELIPRFERRFGVVILEGYGLSEPTVAATMNPLDGPRKPGTVDVAAPGQEIAIMDRSGHLLPTGERGEVFICGYLGNREATATLLRDNTPTF